MFAKLSSLIRYLGAWRGLYFASVGAIALATLFSLAAPLVVKVTLDSVIGSVPLSVPHWAEAVVNAAGGTGRLARDLWICALLYVLLTLAGGLFTYWKGKWSSVASEEAAKALRDRLYDHLQRLSYDYHVKAETGDLIQRCTSDLDTIRRFLSTQLVEVGRALFMVIVAASVMFALDVRLALVSMIAIPIVFAFAIVFFVRIRDAFRLSDESEGRLSTTLQENLTAVRVVRAFAREEFEIGKFDARNREYRDLTYRLIRMLAWYWSTSDLICLLQIGAVLIVGGLLAAKGSISLGTMVVFFTYIGRLLWPVRQMGRILTEMGKTSVSVERIEAVLAVAAERDAGRRLRPHIEGAIEFKGVCFGYDPAKPLLHDLSFRVEPGQTVSILGPTGAGKSSLVHLLPRLYDYGAGSITIDGVELRDIDLWKLREQVGIVLQEPFLFNKTLRQNVTLARSSAEDHEVHEVSRVAALHEVVEKFEEGWETAVGEGGVTLSGGQKQRVAIARALIKEPPILIFDDSLSAVDTETDAEIRRSLAERRHRATTFIISHRVTTLAQADLILVLERGRIVQAGTHEELVAAEGMYRRVWNIQNALEREYRG